MCPEDPGVLYNSTYVTMLYRDHIWHGDDQDPSETDIRNTMQASSLFHHCVLLTGWPVLDRFGSWFDRCRIVP